MRDFLALTSLLTLLGCGAEPTAPMPLQPSAPSTAPSTEVASVYDLPVHLVDQKGQAAGLDVGRGHPVLISMFYGSCSGACPMLIAKLQALQDGLEPERLADLRVVLVSVDPLRDTPEALARLFLEHHLDQRWTLLTGDDDAVRKVAAVLDFKYRKRPDGDFEHASSLLLLDARGTITARADANQPIDELVAILGPPSHR